MHILKHISTRPKGYTFETTLDGQLIEHDTRQCCHCGKHWQIKPGSGEVRGFCRKCKQYTCGKPTCDSCRPQEQQLEEMEKGIWLPPLEI